jgi:cytochrome c biogenesis protein CcmG/thiol:disulfide interchange protein DsbE
VIVHARVFWPVILAAAALVALLAYGIAARGADTSIDQSLADGKRPAAPSIDLPRLGAPGAASLADYRGKVVVLNVWASWCDPCRDEVPLLQRTQERIRSHGATVLGIDTQDASDSALSFLRERRVTYPSLRDRDRSYGQRLGVTGYPETFIIDRRGRVAAVRRFPVDQKWLDRQLPRVLAEKA